MESITTFAFSLAIYLTPLVFLPYILKRDRSTRRVALLIFFLAPLIGEATSLSLWKEQSHPGVATLKFWRTVLLWYPMAIIPLGFWAALLGVVGTRTLRSIAIRFRVRAAALSVIGFFGGAVLGSLFMTIFSLIGSAIQAGRLRPEESLVPYLMAGLFAGSVCGLISGWVAGRPDIGSENNEARST